MGREIETTQNCIMKTVLVPRRSAALENRPRSRSRRLTCIKSGEAPGGIGETGATDALPALCNALFAATGIRLRQSEAAC